MLKKYWPRVLLIAAMLFVVFGVPHVHAQGPHNITLTWTAPTTGGSPATYNILRGTAAGAETALASVPATQLTYVDTTGVGGTTYFYVVNAQNSAGTSPPSNEVSATFLLSAPGAVGSLAAKSN